MLTILLITVASTAEARKTTRGVALWKGCTTDFFTKAYYESYAACRAYGMGIADVLSSGESVAGMKACVPDSATKADVTERVVGWLEGVPMSRREAPAYELVAEAVSTSYPCK